MNIELKWVWEFIGYSASLIILVSLLMTNVFRLRLINLVGSLLFSWYGYLIGSWPVCAINFAISIIDGWYVLQIMRSSAYFELAPATSVGEEYLKRIFLFHEREILKFAPGLVFSDLEAASTCILFRNMLPVGVFSYHQEGQDADILIDFMIPEYRDFKAGRFLYRTKRMFFKERGIKRFHAVARHPSHPKYYLKNGFTEDPDVVGGFVCEL